MDAGTLIAQRYRLVRKIGEGGMGTVYEAEHAITGRHIALKVLQKRDDLPPEARARFLREARAPAAIGHPNVVEILDAGVDDEGHAFIAMELLEGEGMDELMRAEHVVQPQRLAGLMEQLLSALAAMHARGVIHRDLKPANIFLSRVEGGTVRVKVLDFGIAKALGEEVKTRTGYVMGTPAYMAPEQMRSARQVTARSDLWSVGVILYEALVGFRPFRGPTFGLIAQLTGPEPARPISELSPNLPPDLSALIHALLSKDLAQRPGDAAAVRDQLVPLLLRCPPVVPAELPADEQAPPSNPDLLSRTDPAFAPSDDSADPLLLVHSHPTPSPPRASASTSGPLLSVSSSSPPQGVRVSIQSPPPRSLPLVLAGVAVGGLATVAVLYGLLRRTDGADAHTTQGQGAQHTAPDARGASPQPLREQAALQGFLQRWYTSLGTPRGRTALALSAFYAPTVRFRAARGQSTSLDIQRYWTGFFVDNAALSFDWERSNWQEEPASLDAVPATCINVPGASGPVMKVRAWATETSTHHPDDIGCERLEGIYLLRVRRVGASFAICHESWSVQDGICASCPSSRMCQSNDGG